MKRLTIILFSIIISACNSEKAGDCLQASGDIITKNYDIADQTFSRIIVNEGVKLILKQGEVNSIIIESGKNIIDDVKIHINEGLLEISNQQSCNLFREYGLTTVIVTAPNITSLRSSTELDIWSEGILKYPKINIISEDWKSDFLNSGNINLNLDSEEISIVANGISIFYIKGKTKSLNINFASNNPRLEAGELYVENVTLLQRSTNDIIIAPTHSVKGKITSTGDVRVLSNPEIIDVEETYKGRLIMN
ncbi:MAG: head GIN domain-containing protein [Bacteroidota bacterium]